MRLLTAFSIPFCLLLCGPCRCPQARKELRVQCIVRNRRARTRWWSSIPISRFRAPNPPMTARCREPSVARNHRDHHGFTDWFETGFYIFSSRRAQGWDYVGSHIRPRARPPKCTGRGHQPFERNRLAERRYSADTWTWEIRRSLISSSAVVSLLQSHI